MADLRRDSYNTGINSAEDSFRATKWVNAHQETPNTFMKYNGGKFTRHNVEVIKSGDFNRRIGTQYSQISNQNAFKKVKYNQIETLNQLRQEYEILRNLPIPEDYPYINKKPHQSIQSSNHRAPSQSSASHKKHRKKHSLHQSQNQHLFYQVQKKKLQFVIANSMKKIQEFLTKEIEYKKTIHQLELKLDSKQGDQKNQSLMKSMRKNQKDYQTRIDDLEREISRLTYLSNNAEEKNRTLQIQINSKNQEISMLREDRNKFQDSLRNQKNKVSNLQLDLTRYQLQTTMSEKNYKNQIQSLKKYNNQKQITEMYQSSINRLQQDNQQYQRKYNNLLTQFETYKKNIRIEQNAIKPSNNNDAQNSIKIMHSLMGHMKQQTANQNKASLEMISSMLDKMDTSLNSNKRLIPEKDTKMEEKNFKIFDELFSIKQEIKGLKVNDQKEKPQIGLFDNLNKYTEKIRKLEEEIEDGSVSKENLLNEYNILKSLHQNTTHEYQILLKQNKNLREQIDQLINKPEAPPLPTNNNQLHEQYRQKIRTLENKILEQTLKIQNLQKIQEVNQNLWQKDKKTAQHLHEEELQKHTHKIKQLHQEIKQMKSYYQRVIQQKKVQHDKFVEDYKKLSQQHEEFKITYINANKSDMNKLYQKLDESVEIHGKYGKLMKHMTELKAQHQKLLAMNKSVDHLWAIKESQYQNVFDVLEEFKI